MTTATASAPRSEFTNVVWFVGITLAFALAATVTVIASGADPSLLAFTLAFAPAVIAIGLAWREGEERCAGSSAS